MTGRRNEERLIEQLSARAAGCPRADDLQRYAEGRVEPGAREPMARHLAFCDACTAAVKFLEHAEQGDAAAMETPAEVLERNDALIEAIAGTEAASKGSAGSRHTWGWGLGLAAAAALVLVVVLLPQNQLDTNPSPARRGDPPAAIETRIAEDVPLPRDAFVLRWSPAPEGAVYAVRVLSAELQLLHSARELSEAEHRVPAVALEPVAAGATVYWQVEARLPDGGRLVSVTFMAKVE